MAEWGLRVLTISCLLKQTPLRLRGGSLGKELLAFRAHFKDGFRPEVTFLHYAVLGLQWLIGGCLVRILLPHPVI
jgi:hypothetical protein